MERDPKSPHMVMQIAATMGFVGLLKLLLGSRQRHVRLEDCPSSRTRSRRLLIVGVSPRRAALFTRTSQLHRVGYGALWMLLGFIPAMQRLVGPGPAVAQGPESDPWLEQAQNVGIRRGGHGLLAFALLAGAISAFSTSSPVSESCCAGRPGVAGHGAFLRAFGALAWGLWGWWGGPLPFCVHSTRIWIADSFYSRARWGSRSTPRLRAHVPESRPAASSPSPRAERAYTSPRPPPPKPRNHVHGRSQPGPGALLGQNGHRLRKRGRRLPKPDEKRLYYRTALPSTTHLEMNPINGYNFNTRARPEIDGRGLRQPEYFKKPLSTIKRPSAWTRTTSIQHRLRQPFINLGDFGRLWRSPVAHREIPRLRRALQLRRLHQLRAETSPRGHPVFQPGVPRLEARRGSARCRHELGCCGQRHQVPEAENAFREAIKSNPVRRGLTSTGANVADQHTLRGRAASPVEVLESTDLDLQISRKGHFQSAVDCLLPAAGGQGRLDSAAQTRRHSDARCHAAALSIVACDQPWPQLM